MTNIPQRSVAQPNFDQAEIIQPGGRPIPQGLEGRLKFYYVPHGDLRLRVMLASAAVDEPRGSIIFSPGRTEFIEKYFETVESFIKRGFNVLIWEENTSYKKTQS